LMKVRCLRFTPVVVVLLLLSFMTSAVAPLTSPQPSIRDVTYYTMDGVDLKMDVYLPYSVGDAHRPLIVCVHGGGWIMGDKKEDAGISDVPELLSRGYVVASINYRLAPRGKFPAQIEDVKCAVRSLRANAATYHIDTDNIGALGSSAGGHLVSLLGVTNRSIGFDTGQYLEESSRVQAVVDYFGPSDLTATDFVTGRCLALTPMFGLGNVFKWASPVTYVSRDAPPFLIVHGDRDSVVPLSQSQRLYDSLTAAGVPATLVVVKNAAHDFVPIGGPINPTREEITRATADFFDKHLRGIKTTATQTSNATALRSQTPRYSWILIAILTVPVIAFVMRASVDSSSRRNPKEVRRWFNDWNESPLESSKHHS